VKKLHKIRIMCLLTVIAGILIFGVYEYLSFKKLHSGIIPTNPTPSDFTSKNVTSSSDITSKNDTSSKFTSENPSEQESITKNDTMSEDDKTPNTESTNNTSTEETQSNTTVSGSEPKEKTSSESTDTTQEDSTLIESIPTKFAFCQASLVIILLFIPSIDRFSLVFQLNP